MKKIAFFMFSDYTKSWLDSGILDEIAAQSNLIIYGKKTVIKKIRTYAPEICVEEIPEFENSTSTQRLQLISLINRRSESTSFKFRLKRLIFGDLRLVPKGATPSILAKSITYNFKRFIKFTLENPVELISFITPLGRIFENLLRKSFKKNYEKK